MRIGILTLPLHVNYGGILQAWALQTVLENLGHQVRVFRIKQIRGHHWFEMPFVWMNRVIKKFLRIGNVPIFIEIKQKRLNKIKYSKIESFIKRNIKSHFITSLDSIPTKDYNSIVVGSDQIWREDYIRYLWKCESPELAFLSGVDNENIIKIAYSASFGIDSWTFSPESTSEIKKALSTFNGISVREISGVNLLNERTGIEADFVCDPTLLLDSNVYVEKLNIKSVESNSIVSYILDPSEVTDNLIDLISEANQSKVFEINIPDSRGSYRSVEDWVRCFASAKLVITDSFHGCVFSIIFRKPLIFLKNTERGSSRFDTLIETFGLQKNVLRDISEYNPETSYELPEDIDIKLNELRHFSLNFLKQNLS